MLPTKAITSPRFTFRPFLRPFWNLWQCAYSEFWYSNIFWPDFTPKRFEEAIIDYQLRNRRFGGV